MAVAAISAIMDWRRGAKSSAFIGSSATLNGRGESSSDTRPHQACTASDCAVVRGIGNDFTRSCGLCRVAATFHPRPGNWRCYRGESNHAAGVGDVNGTYGFRRPQDDVFRADFQPDTKSEIRLRLFGVVLARRVRLVLVRSARHAWRTLLLRLGRRVLLLLGYRRSGWFIGGLIAAGPLQLR